MQLMTLQAKKDRNREGWQGRERLAGLHSGNRARLLAAAVQSHTQLCNLKSVFTRC